MKQHTLGGGSGAPIKSHPDYWMYLKKIPLDWRDGLIA